MFKNYFKIGIRNLIKQKSSSIINILGLTIGMTAFILIARYVQYEYSYDTQHEKIDQIYRVAQIQKGNTFRGSDRFTGSPEPLGAAMVESFPEVETSTTIARDFVTFTINNEVFSELIMYADENLFDVFTYPIIEGQGKEALKNPNAIIITESKVKKYFPDKSPIGQTIIFREKAFVIKGVMEDIPDNQHFSFDFLLSIKNAGQYSVDKGNWISNNYKTYTVLQEGADFKALEPKMMKFIPTIAEGFKKANLDIHPEFFLQPLRDIHLHSNINFEMGPNGDIRYIWLSISIALIILLLALINYINLSTVRSPQKTRVTGIRKVLGAKKIQLIYQFVTESSIITILSFGMAILLSNLLLPIFNKIMDKEIPYAYEGNQTLFLLLLLVAILLGVFSGVYPALISSSINTVTALKGRWFKNKKDGIVLRNILVIGQFAAAIVLVIGSIIIYQQLNFIQTKKLGYNREQVIFLPYGNQEVFNKIDVIKDQLLKHSAISKTSFSTSAPINMYSQGFAENWEGNEHGDRFGIYRNYIDEDFIDLYEMEIIEGRNFSTNFPTDTMEAYILNEAAVKAIGWKSAVGKGFEEGKVIGVVKDFHFLPFDLRIEPLFLKYRKQSNYYGYSSMALKIKMDKKEEAIAHFQKTVKAIAPQIPFDYQFLDESYNQMYNTEKRFGEAFSIFTFIALFIACIGLFGLVSHNVTQRTKEIGIRKVIGASISNIVLLLSKDFLKLVVLAIIVAFPIAYFFMENWLQDFAYRIEISWPVFLLAGIAALIIAFLTMSLKSIKAAYTNPAKTLADQ